MASTDGGGEPPSRRPARPRGAGAGRRSAHLDEPGTRQGCRGASPEERTAVAGEVHVRPGARRPCRRGDLAEELIFTVAAPGGGTRRVGSRPGRGRLRLGVARARAAGRHSPDSASRRPRVGMHERSPKASGSPRCPRSALPGRCAGRAPEGHLRGGPGAAWEQRAVTRPVVAPGTRRPGGYEQKGAEATRRVGGALAELRAGEVGCHPRPSECSP